MDDAAFDRLHEAAPSAFDGTPVIFAYLFGSHARGEAGPRSDVDVAVYVDGSRRDHMELSLEVAGRLASAAGLGGVEVVILNTAPLPLRGRAIREREVIYSRDKPTRVGYESRTLREFFDYEIHARPLDLEYLRDTARGRR